MKMLTAWVHVYRACHGGCVEEEKEENFVLHVLDEGLVILERHYSRRNRSAERWIKITF